MSHHQQRRDESARKLVKKIESSTGYENEDGDEYGASEFGGLKEYKSRKRLKLSAAASHILNTSPTTPHPKLFHNLIIHITGHTSPPLRELRTLIITHGGQFAPYLDGKTPVTHVVTEGLARGKLSALRGKYRVVRVQWVLDSIRDGKVKAWGAYRVGEEGKEGHGRLSFGSPGGSSGGDLRGSGSGKDVEGIRASGAPASSLSRSMTIPASDEEYSQETPTDPDPSQIPTTSQPPAVFPPPSQLSQKPIKPIKSKSPMPSVPSRSSQRQLSKPPPAPKPVNKPPTSSQLSKFPKPSSKLPKSSKTQESQAPLYTCSCIIGRRTHRRSLQYLIRWVGYPDTESTWEGARSLAEDLGDKELNEMVNEWLSKPQRRVGKATLLSELPRETVEVVVGGGTQVEQAFNSDGEEVPRGIVIKMESAYDEQEPGLKPSSKKRKAPEETPKGVPANSPVKDQQPSGPLIDQYREISDSISHHLMTESDEEELLWGSIFSDPPQSQAPPPQSRLGPRQDNKGKERAHSSVDSLVQEKPRQSFHIAIPSSRASIAPLLSPNRVPPSSQNKRDRLLLEAEAELEPSPEIESELVQEDLKQELIPESEIILDPTPSPAQPESPNAESLSPLPVTTNNGAPGVAESTAGINDQIPTFSAHRQNSVVVLSSQKQLGMTSFEYGSSVDFAELTAVGSSQVHRNGLIEATKGSSVPQSAQILREATETPQDAQIPTNIVVEEEVPVSFNFDTPVDFDFADVGVLTQADPALASTPIRESHIPVQSVPGEEGEDVLMEEEGFPEEQQEEEQEETPEDPDLGAVFEEQEKFLSDSEELVSSGDVEMLEMPNAELLTPREALEEYEYLPERQVVEEYHGEELPERQVDEEDLMSSQNSLIEAYEGLGSIEEPVRAEPTKEVEELSVEALKMREFLSNPHIRSQTVLNPGFMKSYFSHSRLHHLSTWKIAIRTSLLPHISTLTPKLNRERHYILHADLDAFFASASLLSRPDLISQPVAIAHSSSSNTSEIAACNYPARTFNIKAGMWLHRARELCPTLTVLPYDFPRYEAASREFYSVLTSVGAERVEAGSVDEALLDISNLICDAGIPSIEAEEAAALAIASKLRDDVRAATGGLEVSVGIGGNILLAKLALKKAKPAGVFVVRANEVETFMGSVNVGAMPGVGPGVVGRVVKEFGSDSVEVIRTVSKERLKKVLGAATGERLWSACRGIDHRVVGVSEGRKSLAVDVNWGVRFETFSQIHTFLSQLSAEVATRLNSERLLSRHLTLNIKLRAPNAPFMSAKHLGHGGCTNVSKSIALSSPTATAEKISEAAIGLLKSMKPTPWEVRGVGVSMGRLVSVEGGRAQQGVLAFERVPKTDGAPKVDTGALKEALGPLAEGLVPWDRPLPKAYVKPKPASLLDNFLKKPAVLSTPKPSAVVPKPVQSTVAVSDFIPSTQFEIPDNVDEAVIPFLPQELQERIRTRQSAIAAAGAGAGPSVQRVVPGGVQGQDREVGQTAAHDEGMRVAEDFDMGEDLSQPPPNSQYDITVWRALPPEIRSEYAAANQAANQAAQPRAPTASPPGKGKGKAPIEKRQTFLPTSPRKPPRLPWEPQSPSKPYRAPTRPNSPSKPKRKPPEPAGSGEIEEPILDARGNDVSSWLFTLAGIDRHFFFAIPPNEQKHIVATAVRQHAPALAAIAAKERRKAIEKARLANALRLEVRGDMIREVDGVPVGTVEELKRFVRGVWREKSINGVERLVEVLKERWKGGDVALVQEIGRLVGVLVEEEEEEEEQGGEWGEVVGLVRESLGEWGCIL